MFSITMIKKKFFITLLVFLFMTGCKTPPFPTQNQEPAAIIKVNTISSDLPPLEVQFDGSDSYDADGEVVSYNWDFGDETSGTGITTSHTYNKGGIYNAVLTVTDDDGDAGTASVTITIRCDIIHEGDLIIQGSEIYEIKDCVFCQNGNIFVRDNAQLVVKDAVLKLNQPAFQSYVIQVYSYVLMENAQLLSDYSFGFQVFGKAYLNSFKIRQNSRLYSEVEGIITATNSQLGGICFHGNSSFMVTDSEILDMVDIDALYTENASIKIAGLYPKTTIDYWNSHENMTIEGTFADLTLNNTYVNRWIVRAGGENTTLEIRDSEISWFRIGADSHQAGVMWTVGPSMVIDSTIDALTCIDYDGSPLTFENSQLRGFLASYARLNILGTFVFDGNVTMESAQVTRNYPVIVNDVSGSSLSDIDLALYSSDGTPVWSGKSDPEGKAEFDILFTDANYEDVWTLNAASFNITLDVDFRTDTPIVITEQN